MIAIDKPFEELMGVSRCPGCGKTLVYFKDDMKKEISDSGDNPLVIEYIYTKCPDCGEVISYESVMHFKEEDDDE